jgi:thioredoxin-related protein
MNEKLKNIKERAGKFFSITGKVVIILISMMIGFYINEIRRDRKTEKNKKHVVEEHMPIVRSQKETSVAINERGEIIVIDRKNVGT